MRHTAIVLAVILGTSCSSPNDGEPNNDGMIILARKAVEAKLRDPASAEYRNEKLGSFKGHPVVCGEVNAKNGFGGMTGFERYASNGGEATVVESDMDAPEFSKVWAMMNC